MRHLLTTASALLLTGTALTTFALYAAPASATESAAPATPATSPTVGLAAYNVDGVHSSALFRISHLNVANFYGVMHNMTGTVHHDAADPAATRLHITGKVADINTGNAQRDRHLQSADFFNMREHEEITFNSTSAEVVDGKLHITGDFTMHGVTRPVTFELVKTGERDAGGRFGYRLGLEATFTVKRSDFGMNYMPDALGDEVRITVGLSTVRE